MSYRVAVANQKGGVGKTTISLGLAGILSEMGKKVLLVDMDQQGNLSSVFFDDINLLKPTVFDLLVSDNVEIKDVVKKTNIKNIDILPANLSLSNLDAQLAGEDDAQYYLMEELNEINSGYDFVIVDCPPSLSRATRMSLVAAHGVIVPIECQEWAVKGATRFDDFVQRVKHRANSKLQILGFLINKFNPRRSVETAYNQALRAAYPNKIFKTEFNNNVQFTESASARLPINYYLPKSKQAEVFRNFVNEFLTYV